MAKRILLVEDDPINIRFMSVCLQKKGGYEVLVSEVVEEILQIAHETEDLVGIIIFLCSSDSAFMTGQTMLVDGGTAFV